MKICFFGSSLVSSYWNGAATYYRGILKALAALGHEIVFFEPDAFERQSHRDISDPEWAKVIVYPATSEGWQRSLEEAVRCADLLVKASGVGVFDRELEIAVAETPTRARRVYWDVDAPATLDEIAANPTHHLHAAIPHYDVVFTYGGGAPVVRAYRSAGARDCVPIYNALDPTNHFPVDPVHDFSCKLGFLGNRLPDRESRVDAFFLGAARRLPHQQFLLGGSGWETKELPANVKLMGHVGTNHHNAFFCSGLATLNVNRESMARYGFSPPTRVFEAVGAGACLITDRWKGIDLFLEPNREVLVAADGEQVAAHLDGLTPGRAREIATRARRRILAHHTYAQRALQVHELLEGSSTQAGAAG
ncbi:MAG: glycosyltransferase [Bradyrhizobium sp.]|jgi:spore maturation protein CgeB